MPVRPMLIAAVLAMAACSSPEDIARKTGARSEATAVASASAQAGGAVKVEEDTKLYSYEFSYPAAVGAIPELARLLTGRAEQAKEEMIAEAKAAHAEAQGSDYPMNSHSYGATWKVVADLPGYLSLSNDFYTYTGGAHGMYGLEGLVWDKAKGRALPSEALFQSPGFLDSTMDGAVCAAINKERAERRGEPVRDTGEMFDECPGLDDATILVGSSNGKTFDRITVYFGPYVAGPYVEGAYELDFPMTKAMLEAVKPAYRAAFSTKL
jgi:hypothetical protein